MDIKEEYYIISRIMAKELTGDITDAEKEYLQQWLAASKDNQKMHAKIKADGWYQANQEVYGHFDVEKGWDHIQAKMERGPKVIQLRSKLFRYAAVAASAALLVSGFLFRDGIKEYFHPQSPRPIITNNTIVPGSNRATLTLSNGEEFVLDKKDSLAIGNALSTGNQIVYHAAGNPNGMIEFNTLTVPRGGQFSLMLSDSTKVWLNSESQIRYPVRFQKGTIRRLELVYGEAYFDVTPSERHHGAAFVVAHGHQQVEVLGTEFNIKGYSGEPEIRTTLVEGKVKVTTDGATKILQPGQQARLNVDTGHISVKMVDVFREVSWKEGIFSFKDRNLKDIMKVLSRWYDMEVVFVTKDLEKATFNGTLRKDQSIEEVLSLLQGSIDTYEINDRTILLK